MTINQYLKESARTDADLGDKNYVHWQIGVFNEFGKLMGPLKKALVKEDAVDTNKLLDEAGDVFWYIAKGIRVTKTVMPETYAYEEHDDLIKLIKAFNNMWNAEDLVGLMCIMFNLCEMYRLNPEEAMAKNINKLQARHPEGFNIDNPKHTQAEEDAKAS